MIRRLNFTGRIKIFRADVRLITSEDLGALSFDADLRLQDYELPADALVYVEAYRQATWMRFPFGTVANLLPPPYEQRLLSEFDSADGIRFRVKITQSHDEHILLAAADHISLAEPDEDSDRESLLPVVPAEIGDEIWQLDESEAPRLLINKAAVSDWRQLAMSPVFIALVYPVVLRQILTEIITSGHRDTDDGADWRSKWLRFSTQLPGVNPNLPDKDESEEITGRWINEAVGSFARRLELKTNFSAAWLARGNT